MPKRRGNNEGSIVKRKDGRWQAAISLGYDDTGRPKRSTFYGCTRAEAKEKMDEALAQVKAVSYQPNHQTLQEWFAFWLENYAKPSIRPTTYRSYDNLSESI